MTSTKSIQTQHKRVLAFDPGFERLGVAVLEKIGSKETLVHSECVRTPKTLLFAERLNILGAAAEKLIQEYAPTAIALEDVYFAKNEKTAMKIAEVRGMLTYITLKNKLDLHQYTPSEVKVAITGYGKSDKSAIAAMVPRLVVLPIKKRLDDELDAIAVGLTCLASVR
ncbi:MAG: crossover junction endodeoxyribonuclease RuvC [Candidatus Pacebacteria bacterium]|nr:crossover junction endodeoxyribonuclease RuvC [Candidatus Paceibacterota bacterium]